MAWRSIANTEYLDSQFFFSVSNQKQALWLSHFLNFLSPWLFCCRVFVLFTFRNVLDSNIQLFLVPMMSKDDSIQTWYPQNANQSKFKSSFVVLSIVTMLFTVLMAAARSSTIVFKSDTLIGEDTNKLTNIPSNSQTGDRMRTKRDARADKSLLWDFGVIPSVFLMSLMRGLALAIFKRLDSD